MSDNNLALVEESDLSLIESNSLNAKQLDLILKRTPAKYIKKRPAKGGGQWEYVTGGYIKKCLNLMFGWDWDFEIVSEQIQFGEAIVKGRLTCRSNGKMIVKMQYGNKDVIYRKQSAEEVTAKAEKIPLSIGNDLKAAATDCLKKCAAEIGIAADIYNKEDFNEVRVDTSEVTIEDLKILLDFKRLKLAEEEIIWADRIIAKEEVTSYKKLNKFLKAK
jgi:hypothetical protein